MITLDFETFATVDLRKRGVGVYAQHPDTEVMCLAWAVDDKPVQLWLPGEPIPEKLAGAIAAEAEFEAHNAGFERLIWFHVMHKRLGWPDVGFDQWRCSAAACARLGLPRSLEGACDALGLDVKKDKEGQKLMLRLCKPKKPSKKDPSTRDRDPSKLKRLYEYCKTDVEAERALSAAIGPLPPSELEIWRLDQRANLRGLHVDRPNIEHAVRLVEQVYGNYCDQLSELTGGAVQTVKQVAALRQWIDDQGCPVPPSLDKEHVALWLDRDDLTPEVRAVLEVRQSAAKSSNAKLQSMLDRSDDTGRVQNGLIYHGAHTGRWAGSGIQPQNYVRGWGEAESSALHTILPTATIEDVDLLLAPPIDAVSNSLRSFIKAKDGNRFLVCDFAAIEARVLAWVFNQESQLAIFAAGGDVYKELASKIYEIPVNEVSPAQRFIGKTAILGLGYGMSWRGFRLWITANGGSIDNAMAKAVVKIYRTDCDKVRKAWTECNTAAIRAVETCQPHRVGRLEFVVDSNWLRIKLPSGRYLHYRNPEITQVRAPWTEGYTGTISGPESLKEQLEDIEIDLGLREDLSWVNCDIPKRSASKLKKVKGISLDLQPKEPEMIKQVQFQGVVGQSRKWGVRRTYGGMLVENICQAVARDLLAAAMLRVEKAGYPVVATIHDEIIADVPDRVGSLQEFETIMKEVPRWAKGCPVDVEGYESRRYRK